MKVVKAIPPKNPKLSSLLPGDVFQLSSYENSTAYLKLSKQIWDNNVVCLHNGEPQFCHPDTYVIRVKNITLMED